MKLFAFFVLAMLTVSIAASAQTSDDAIATAVQALPANMRADATVIKWKPDFTYETLRKGTNGLVCYHLLGPDKDHARMHVTIALPGATTQST